MRSRSDTGAIIAQKTLVFILILLKALCSAVECLEAAEDAGRSVNIETFLGALETRAQSLL